MVTEYQVVRFAKWWWVVETPATMVRTPVAGPFVTERQAIMAMPMKSRLVKQDELQAALNARLVVETLKRQVKEAEDERDRIELVLISRIGKGDPIQPGELAAIIEHREGRRTPKWKEEFATLAGPQAVEQVIARTAPSPGEDKLIISAAGRVAKTA